MLAPMFMLKVDVPVVVSWAGEKLDVAAGGTPAAVKTTGCVSPFRKVTVKV